MRWRLYYGDGTTYSGDPFYAPPVNAQVLVRENSSERGFSVNYGKFAYFWRPDVGWNACDEAGLWDYLMLYCGPKAIVFGRVLRDEEFWETVKRAMREGLG